MKEIILTKGKTVVVDDEDYEKFNQFKWYALKGCNTFYAARNSPMINAKKGSCILMHREILGLIAGNLDGDHRDGDGLNNRRNNLRVATKSQNQMNQQKIRGNSKFRGVCWDKSREKWLATIRFERKSYNLGRFNNESDAACAYDKKAQELFGEFARLNFPMVIESL